MRKGRRPARRWPRRWLYASGTGGICSAQYNLRCPIFALMGLSREVDCDMSAKGRVVLAGQGVANSSSLCALDLCGTACVCTFACMMLITARVPCPTVYALCVCVCLCFCISIRASVYKSVSVSEYAVGLHMLWDKERERNRE